ncbi:calcium homeostasis modulator protein 6-like, partial [Clarias magur]
MSGGGRITEFLRSRVGNLGVSSLVLVVLEKMMDSDFVCPCQPGYNEVICACYATVPFITCFIFTFCFVDPIPEDKGIQCNSTCVSKVFYSLFIAFIWLFLFFVDGQYMSCAISHWGGEYTETGALKWCKPNGSETVVLEREKETQRYMTVSQFIGFGIAFLIALGLLALHYNYDWRKKNPDETRQDNKKAK